MLIAIIGENCVGKSTLADKIKTELQAESYSGKDYLRLEKNPSAAIEAFKKRLQEAITGKNVIYIVTEKEHLELLPDGAFKILLTAELRTIKERFKARMRGNLPSPVEKMLESKHGMYDGLDCDLKLDGDYNTDEVLSVIYQHMNM